MKDQPWIKNKICIVTGANTGIGKETARKLAEKGAHVIMVCRNGEKGEIARQDLLGSTKNPHIDLIICNLADLNAIRQFSTYFQQRYSKLHVLINNAGVFSMKRKTTENGIESTFGVNYLAHFYLTNLLLPMMKKSVPARIINLGSDIHKFFKIKMDNLQLIKRYNGQQAYSNSKSAMILFTYKLAREIEGDGITVNAAHPGHVKTQMTTKGLPKIFLKISEKITRQLTPEQGAETPVYLASSEEVQDVTGKYFSKCRAIPSAKFTYDHKIQENLWKYSDELIESPEHS
ncbi:MAG: SDR family oxidoreductase [Promethearchaeota archaeon]